MSKDRPEGAEPRRVLVLGATGTIGRATVRALVSRGHEVVCLVRRPADTAIPAGAVVSSRTPAGATERIVDLTDPLSLARDGVRGESFDVLVSCLASRTGLPDDAWAIDYRAQVSALHASRAAGVTHAVLLSAICVQKPILAFQHAKLAFEAVLIASGLDYTIVRPTAFFKSLSGQIDRLKRGKPFLVFGDGTLTACKPISDDDLGRYLADCLHDDERRNRVLPIGGPGEAITPKAQGERLFAMLGREPRFTHVPVVLLDVIVAVLATIGRWVPALAVKAELARIGRYYATESMLVLDPATGRYDAQATPSTGSETLFGYYARVIRGEAVAERGDHAVF
ncbi:NAD(P)H-binding protein [Methylobacterium durans]|uniref:Divinyl chlorophyllide a 8-vinyl-reductase, chloroplastic n=1 Tax=Methylobacterium durans TaxID=2202825 RepID=A0A2U8WC20_9HYPH|nr:NAD(P)H-binding protein [Methylobacterium durans]AWN42866.1 epimerase [Methylobacterium durans]